MPKRRLRQYKTNEIIDSISARGADYSEEVLVDLCPCRNRVFDLEIWREIFKTARGGSHRARHRAAHTIATLLHKAQTSPRWRELLQTLDEDLDRTMSDPIASSALVGQVAHQAGNARTLKGSALQTYRHQRRVLDLASREDLASWVNDLLRLEKHRGVPVSHPGIDRLWRWLTHRTTFQRRRPVRQDELGQKAAQWLPEFFHA